MTVTTDKSLRSEIASIISYQRRLLSSISDDELIDNIMRAIAYDCEASEYADQEAALLTEAMNSERTT